MTNPERHDKLIEQCREMVAEVRAHEHPYRDDYYCLNHVAYMGERMNFVLAHIDAIEAELAITKHDLETMEDEE